MAAEQIGQGRHGNQHRGEAEPVMLGRPGEQQGVAQLVDREAAGRDREEARQRPAQRRAVAAKAQVMMAAEGQAHGADPAQHIGGQRWPLAPSDQGHHHQPVQGGGGAAGGDKPGETAVLAHQGAEHSPARRLLCLCADDIGLHAGIHRAALALVARGRLQALSCQVGGPAWAEAAAALRGLGTAAELGLHLDLSERPLILPARPLARLILRSQWRMLDPASLDREIEAQLDAFERGLGRAPDYVDGHQHVHQLPQVREALLAALARRYPGRPLWLRSTRRGAPGFKPWLIERLGAAALARAARAQGLAQNGRLLGVYDFRGGPARYLALLRGWLGAARSGDLLMCHPGLGDGADPLAAARRAELAVLAGPDFGVLLAEQGLSLAQMRQILAGA